MKRLSSAISLFAFLPLLFGGCVPLESSDEANEDEQLGEAASALNSLPDLTAATITRDATYYYVRYCNQGLPAGGSFSVSIKNVGTGQTFTTPVAFTVPATGSCAQTGGITCGLIGGTCSSSISVEANVDAGNGISESNNVNNKVTANFASSLPDLTAATITRNGTYYYVQYCNQGGTSATLFNVSIKNTGTGQTFTTPTSFSVPAKGSCAKTGGITCGLIGSNCSDAITVQASVDATNTISESLSTNNVLSNIF